MGDVLNIGDLPFQLLRYSHVAVIVPRMCEGFGTEPSSPSSYVFWVKASSWSIDLCVCLSCELDFVSEIWSLQHAMQIKRCYPGSTHAAAHTNNIYFSQFYWGVDKYKYIQSNPGNILQARTWITIIDDVLSNIYWPLPSLSVCQTV